MMRLPLGRANALVILLAATALAGCMAPQRHTSATANQTAEGGRNRLSSNTPAESASNRAAQAKRDSEWLLDHSARSEPSSRESSAERNPLGDIQWGQSSTDPDEGPWAPPEMAATPDRRQRASRTASPPTPLPAQDLSASPAPLPTTQPATDPTPAPQLPVGKRGKGWPNDASSRELLAALSRELYRDATFSKAPLRPLLTLAAISLVTPNRELSAEALPGLSNRERDMVAAFGEFFLDLGRRLDNARHPEAVIEDALASLQRSLTQERQLELPVVALCSRIGGFGEYSEFDRYAFMAHAGQQVIVYVEVDGFTSELNKQGVWVTELSQQLVIYSDRDGIPVWREDWQTAVDMTNQKRRDYFQRQIVTLPKALSVGLYQLKVRLRDEQSGSEAEVAIPFEMVADPRLAAHNAVH